MSLCDPDPGRSSERDCDVTATAPRNVNELAGVGDVRLKLARPEDQNNNHCGEIRRAVFSRGNGNGGGLKKERNSGLYWYGKRQRAILIRPIQP